MRIDSQLIRSYWFTGAVGLLLLNDFILKQTLHNWLTGKLSDFAGVFILPLFLAIFFPKRIKTIIPASALFFVFWKSPWSSGLIEWINMLPLFSYSRVVDYTDLIALLILPLSYWIYSRKNELNVLKIKPIYPLAISVFALLATSQEFGFMPLNESFVVPQNQTTLFNTIQTDSASFANNGINIQLNDSAVSDTLYFQLILSQGLMTKPAWILASMSFIDSSSTEFYFFESRQDGDDCGFFRARCEEKYDEKEVILEEIETRFLDLL